jgi:hypothetical protein
VYTSTRFWTTHLRRDLARHNARLPAFRLPATPTDTGDLALSASGAGSSRIFLETYMNNSPNSNAEPTRPTGAPTWSRKALIEILRTYNPKGGDQFSIKGYWVHTRTLHEAFNLFWQSARGLDKSKLHRAESLACTPAWKDRPDGWKKGMGRCFKLLAVNGVLPITVANPEAPYNFKYRLNDDLDQEPSIQ